MEELREVRCHRSCCSRVFWLCRRCDRGQRYCSEECRRHARERSVRKARRNYARKELGRENNRKRQRRYRARMTARQVLCTNRVTDHSSQKIGEQASWANVAASITCMSRVRAHHRPDVPRDFEPGHCSVCGRPGVVVRKGARRGRFRPDVGQELTQRQRQVVSFSAHAAPVLQILR